MLTQIMASNAGGTATLIGYPPNIMIGTATNLSFMDFIRNTGAAVVLSMIVSIICYRLIYKKSLTVDEKNVQKVMQPDEHKSIKDKRLMNLNGGNMIFTMQASGVHAEPLWWMGACLGGNSTLIGASANVVLAGISKNAGYPISFGKYFIVGFPIMLISIAVCSVFLLIKFTYFFKLIPPR